MGYRGVKEKQGWKVGDADGRALLKHWGVLGGCRCVHIISQAGHGTQRVTIGRTRLLHSPLLAKAMHLCNLTHVH